MVLVRIAYAADLPTPDEVIRSLDGNAIGWPCCRQRQCRRCGAAECARPRSAPRFEAPRGAPRAALAQPAGDPAPRTVQAAPGPAMLAVGHTSRS